MTYAEQIQFLTMVIAALIALLGLAIALCLALTIEARRARHMALLANPNWHPDDDDKLMPGTRWLVERMRKAGAL